MKRVDYEKHIVILIYFFIGMFIDFYHLYKFFDLKWISDSMYHSFSTISPSECVNAQLLESDYSFFTPSKISLGTNRK